MYSPKIKEDLIPNLYRIGKDLNIPMTQIVDDVLRTYLPIYVQFRCNGNDPDSGKLETILEGKITGTKICTRVSKKI